MPGGIARTIAIGRSFTDDGTIESKGDIFSVWTELDLLGEITADEATTTIRLTANREFGATVSLPKARIFQIVVGSENDEAARGRIVGGDVTAQSIGTIVTHAGFGVTGDILGLIVGQDLSGEIKVLDGHLGDVERTNQNERDFAVKVGGEIHADTIVSTGSVTSIATGLVSSGAISGDIRVTAGNVESIEVYAGMEAPVDEAKRLGPGRVPDIDVEDNWVISVATAQPIPLPVAPFRPSFESAGNISGKIEVKSTGEVYTLGGVTGSITSATTIGSTWVFGEIGPSAIITVGTGGLTGIAWENVGGNLTASGAITLDIYGDFYGELTSSNSTIDLGTWGGVTGNARLEAADDAVIVASGDVLASEIATANIAIETFGILNVPLFAASDLLRLTAGEGLFVTDVGESESLISTSFGDSVFLSLAGRNVLTSDGDVTVSGGNYGTNIHIVASGDVIVDGDLNLDYGEAVVLARGSFEGNISVGVDTDTSDDWWYGEFGSEIRIDASEIQSGTELEAHNIVIASNGDVNAEMRAVDNLVIDAQGTINGFYRASEGLVQMLAGEGIGSSGGTIIEGERYVALQSRGSIDGDIRSDAGFLTATSMNGLISGSCYGHASAEFVGREGVDIVGVGTNGLVSSGFLDVFTSQDISAGSTLYAGGEIGIESWGDINGEIHAGHSQSESRDAVVISHGSIPASISATGDLSVSAVGNLSGSIESFDGAVGAQVGGTFSSDITANSDINVIAGTTNGATLNSAGGNIESITLLAAEQTKTANQSIRTRSCPLRREASQPSRKGR